VIIVVEDAITLTIVRYTGSLDRLHAALQQIKTALEEMLENWISGSLMVQVNRRFPKLATSTQKI
jgi:hypothetical protein